MNMQDNEFDDLFRNKLDNFEAEPSAKVWPGIENELGRKDAGKGGFFILKIAASIIVLLTAGILFIPKGHKDQHQKPDKIVKSNPKLGVMEPEQTQVAAPAGKDAQLAVAPLQYSHTISPVITKRKVSTPSDQHVIINPKQEETIAKVEPTTPVVISQKPEIKMPLTTQDTAARLIAKSDVPDVVAPAKVEPTIVAQAPFNSAPKQTVKRRGIHNFGELVNLVVAKVDKRKDKAIEFSDSDDDDSSVTGINIGPFKIKKENNKD